MFSLNIYLSVAILYVLFSLQKARAGVDKCDSVGSRVSEEDPCYINGVPTECQSSYELGAIVVKKCKPAYIKDHRENATFICNFNGWKIYNHLCQPDCGSQTEKSKYPWIAAIYNSEEELVCTGTIISTYHVLTAAHCFTSGYDDQIIDPSNYTIIAGKHYINLHRNKDSTQKRKIYVSTVHNGYSPQPVSRVHDVVLLEIDEEFEINDDVRPACIDWDSFYEEWDLQDGNEAIAVGWQFDKTEVIPCKNVDAPNVQYWQRTTCFKNLPSAYPYTQLEEDKFCAEYIGNDDSTCGKAIGSGVFFKSTHRRYFLRGITTVIDSKSNYILYTRVSYYLTWLTKHITKNYKFHFPGINDAKTRYTDYGCILPDNFQYGSFSLTTGTTYTKGKWVPPSTTILMTCNGRQGSDPVLSFRCSNKEWYPSIDKALCRKPGTCPTIKASEAEEVFCKLNGRTVSCKDAQSNTTAVVRCQPYFTFPGHRPIYKCLDGEWDQTFTPCTLECGLKRVGAETLAVGGVETIKNEYPWVVGIYNSRGDQICGGTIISRKFVISAAHCFGNFKGVMANKDNFTIIAGKYYRDISIEEQSSQKKKIKSLFIHEDYKASLRKFRDDIALIEVDTEFTPTMEVEPVCVDWEDAYEDIDLINGNEGIVAGWGFTREGGSPSDVLKKITVPFRPKDVCLENLPEHFSDQYVTTDKICAGYVDNNTNVCKGDSGGGLYFKSDRSRYFIRGIVSLTVKSTIGCDTNQFALYTKVSKYLLWMESMTRKVL